MWEKKDKTKKKQAKQKTKTNKKKYMMWRKLKYFLHIF